MLLAYYRLRWIFLRTKFKNELLVALGRDGNEQNFPITRACMKSVQN